MGTKSYCDSCGEEVYSGWLNTSGYHLSLTYPSSLIENIEADLCKDCIREIEKEINNKLNGKTRVRLL